MAWPKLRQTHDEQLVLTLIQDFSTAEMRVEGGMKHIEAAIAKVQCQDTYRRLGLVEKT